MHYTQRKYYNISFANCSRCVWVFHISSTTQYPIWNFVDFISNTLELFLLFMLFSRNKLENSSRVLHMKLLSLILSFMQCEISDFAARYFEFCFALQLRSWAELRRKYVRRPLMDIWGINADFCERYLDDSLRKVSCCRITGMKSERFLFPELIHLHFEFWPLLQITRIRFGRRFRPKIKCFRIIQYNMRGRFYFSRNLC